MNRRDMFLGGMAAVGTSWLSHAQAAEAPKDHHHHMMMANDSLTSAAADCIQKGQACLSHCLMMLGDGDKTMAGCSKSVNQMLAMCTALQQLANQQSPLLPKFATLAMEACKQCEDECKKHADKHQVCKDCAESCAACYKQCKAIAA